MENVFKTVIARSYLKQYTYLLCIFSKYKCNKNIFILMYFTYACVPTHNYI